MSTASRLAAIEQALATRQPPHVIEVQLVCCSSRAEHLALEKSRRNIPSRPGRRPPVGFAWFRCRP